MTQYLLSVHSPAEYGEHGNYGSEEAMLEAFAKVDAFNTELEEAGKWVFGGGLEEATTATVVRADGDEVLHSDGPYLESKEFIGGFWVIEAADLDEALAWAARASRACMGAVEVRPFQGEPEDA